jgi:tetratricopeptide (TPR) repeat protein
MKKTLMSFCGALALVLLAAASVAAQGLGRLDGQIFDPQGNPYPDVTVVIRNPDSGQTLTVKTDKNGKFTALGLRTAVYNLTITNEKDHLTFQDQFHVDETGENNYKLNLKEMLAKQAGAHPEEVKKHEEEEQKREGMKQHYDAGLAAINDAKNVRTQLQAAPADQGLKDKLAADYQTAQTELKQAEQLVNAKETGNHATIWAQLGVADEGLAQWGDAADAFGKAAELKPQPGYYVAEATDLAKAGKFDDAPAACDKAVAADPTQASVCYKNLGIVLSNGGKFKEAIAFLQKATTADPKDAQGWYLLGNALAATIDSKQEGEKMIYIIPPGTKEAYQKCIDANPSGPYAAQAKESLAGLEGLDQGVDTTVGKRPTTKKKGSGN